MKKVIVLICIVIVTLKLNGQQSPSRAFIKKELELHDENISSEQTFQKYNQDEFEVHSFALEKDILIEVYDNKGDDSISFRNQFYDEKENIITFNSQPFIDSTILIDNDKEFCVMSLCHTGNKTMFVVGTIFFYDSYFIKIKLISSDENRFNALIQKYRKLLYVK